MGLIRSENSESVDNIGVNITILTNCFQNVWYSKNSQETFWNMFFFDEEHSKRFFWSSLPAERAVTWVRSPSLWARSSPASTFGRAAAAERRESHAAAPVRWSPRAKRPVNPGGPTAKVQIAAQ